MKWPEREGFRFLVAGALNTAIGYGLYLLLNLAFDYRVAYTLSYLLGIVLSFVLNSRYVFRQPIRWKRILVYPVVYVLQYGLGLLFVWVFVGLLHQPEALAPIAAVAVSLPLTYFASRHILSAKPHAPAQH
ncbi:MAG: GtrA family protein [Lysobacter sp.]|nr:GtrA family protein [Lysobacter sp.]